MSVRDVFQETLEAKPTEDGPFRTAEPTEEQRYERAREASLARVAEVTERELARERARAGRRRRLARGALAIAVIAAAATITLGTLRGAAWMAWSCPALTAVIALAIVVLKLGRPRRRPRV